MPGIEFEDLQNKTKTTFDDLQKMVLTLSTIVAELEALPPGINMTMRLAYNKHCPKDYLPPGFNRDSKKQPNIDSKHKVCIRAGSIASKFHGIKLKAAFDTRSVGRGFKRSRYELFEECEGVSSDEENKDDLDNVEDNTPRNNKNQVSSKRLNFDTMDTLATSAQENTDATLEQDKTADSNQEITPRNGTNNYKEVNTPDSDKSPFDPMNQSMCPPENETFESATSQDTLSEMNDKTRKTTASSYINTPESRVSFDQHEFSPIEKDGHRDGLSLDMKVPSPYKPLSLPSKDLGKSNFIIELLQYLILRKFYSPLLIQTRFNLTKKVMWELTGLLEDRQILPCLIQTSLKRREVCGWKAYKLLREECKYRDLNTDAGLDDIYRDTWNETITTINFELAKINRAANKARKFKNSINMSSDYDSRITDSSRVTDSSYRDSSFGGGISSCEKEYLQNRKHTNVKSTHKKSHRSVSFLESTMSSVNRSNTQSMLKRLDKFSINEGQSMASTITNTSLNESSNSATLGANTPVRFL